MAKVTNAFIKSKMNQDLDARLLPNGEYREGLNIQVSKSEGPDVGALENVLGNILLNTPGEENLDLRTNVFRTNFEGPANILSEIANLFEKRSYGTIVGISSVAGERGRASN